MPISTTTDGHHRRGANPATGLVRKPRPATTDTSIKRGRWERWERVAFLRGLKKYGRGHWKMISSLIPTRTTIQVKTHAQVMLKKVDKGENIFGLLRCDDRERTANSNASMTVKIGGGGSSTKAPWSLRSLQRKMTPIKRRKSYKNLLRKTPENRDFDAAEVLADLHFPTFPL